VHTLEINQKRPTIAVAADDPNIKDCGEAKSSHSSQFIVKNVESAANLLLACVKYVISFIILCRVMSI
jgi:hypothetical protein